MYVRETTEALKRRLLQPHLPFIQAVVGPRQVGKSTAIEQIAAEWDGPKVLAVADSPVPFDAEWIHAQWLDARSRRGRKKVLLVFDEIQKVKGWAEVVKKMFDEDRKSDDLRIVILGSSHLAMDRGLSESLAGRFELFPVAHWLGYECCDAFGWDFDKYLAFGGYPAAASLAEDTLRWQKFIRDSILEPVLSRDVLLLEQVRNPALLRQTLALALQASAQVLSFNKMLGQLQERGNASTVKGYLELLEKAFLIKLVYRYSGHQLSVRASSPKLVPLCPALIHAFIDPSSVGGDSGHRGHLIEAMVGAKLALCDYEVFYWREGDYEVDFVLKKGRLILGIEVRAGLKKKAKSLRLFKARFPRAKWLQLEGTLLEDFLMKPGCAIIEEALS